MYSPAMHKLVKLAKEVAKTYYDAADWKDAYGRLNKLAELALEEAYNENKVEKELLELGE